MVGYQPLVYRFETRRLRDWQRVGSLGVVAPGDSATGSLVEVLEDVSEVNRAIQFGLNNAVRRLVITTFGIVTDDLDLTYPSSKLIRRVEAWAASQRSLEALCWPAGGAGGSHPLIAQAASHPHELARQVSRTGADIDLLGELDIGSREPFRINAFECPGGSLPAGFSALDPGESRLQPLRLGLFIVPQNSGFDLRQRVMQSGEMPSSAAASSSVSPAEI